MSGSSASSGRTEAITIPPKPAYTRRTFFRNFETAGTRFGLTADLSHTWTVLRVEHLVSTTVVHTMDQVGTEARWSLEELDRRRSLGEIDFVEHSGKLETEHLTSAFVMMFNLSEDAAFKLTVNLRLLMLVDEVRLVEAKDGRAPSVRYACKKVTQRVIEQNGLIATDDYGPELKVPVSEIPSEHKLRKLYPHYDQFDLAALAPYATSKQRSIPTNSPFSQARFCAVYHDVLSDAMRPSERKFYTTLKAIYDEIVVQIADERRLHALGFVQAEDGRPFGPRSQRNVLKVFWDEGRGICVAVGRGGDVFFRPCNEVVQYLRLLDRMLRPPDFEECEHPRTRNKPYYDEAVDPRIVAGLRKTSGALASLDYRGLWQYAREQGPLKKLQSRTFYDNIRKLPPLQRARLPNAPNGLRQYVQVRLGREPAFDVDTCWQFDFVRPKLIVTDDDCTYPIGRLIAAIVADETSTARLGAALDFGGETTDVAIRALRMALASTHLMRLLVTLLRLERPLFGGRKSTIIRWDHGPASRSYYLVRALTVLGPIIVASQKGEPTYKSEIEAVMKDTGQIVERLPGFTPRGMQRLREMEYDPKADAFIRVSHAVRAFYRGVFDEHNHKPIPSLGHATPHQVYSTGREALGPEYDASPSDKVLEVFLAHYYANCSYTPAGVDVDGLPYRLVEGSLIKDYLYRTDLLVTRDPWNLSKAYIVDLKRRTYVELAIDARFANEIRGVSYRQWKVIKSEGKTIQDNEVRVETLKEQGILASDQNRRDTLNSLDVSRALSAYDGSDKQSRELVGKMARIVQEMRGHFGQVPSWVGSMLEPVPALRELVRSDIDVSGSEPSGGSTWENKAAPTEVHTLHGDSSEAQLLAGHLDNLEPGAHHHQPNLGNPIRTRPRVRP